MYVFTSLHCSRSFQQEAEVDQLEAHINYMQATMSAKLEDFENKQNSLLDIKIKDLVEVFIVCELLTIFPLFFVSMLLLYFYRLHIFTFVNFLGKPTMGRGN
jgi:hypothetical protein